MYLHLGNSIIVKDRDIIGIFDLENTTVSRFTKEFLRGQTDNNLIINVTDEIPKSFIVTSNIKVSGKGKNAMNKSYNKKENTYLSQISTATLNCRNNISL